MKHRASLTTSLSSYIKNHIYENGRRYHAYNEGKYFAPNDEAENDRLDMHNHMARLAIGGKLHTAPIGDNPQRILDVGCGTGIWTIDIGDEYPSAEVIGIDLSPTQPPMVPPNVRFEVDNAEEEWTYSKKFDFIHCRWMAGSILNWPRLVSRVYKNLKPGGWFECQDYDIMVTSSDGSLTAENTTYQWNALCCEALEKINIDHQPGAKMKRWCEDVGFESVQEEILFMPLGIWPKDKKYKEIGAWNYLIVTEGLEALSLRLFTKVLGWNKEEVEVLCAKVRTELKTNRKIHPLYKYHVVIGQKPNEKGD
ncbi:S-adenosyl-L-methionine-dependent methyltransferase [Hyaloscypha bicolor E]|uniref:S-adenosyl-L-methionine-dependent methyltransferase n=1 Tax=Hyaloscypha bicolor E TaxID=1095630 RepID=A0A2J6TN68_9HELO|nr:S-adenosyl-L-methionine-dependent methyltransferase [Hyaloscypha bicolor E]PMD64476.1 S-adenosyl-L-methionine-dependent methyltransferase [Hyaloscypha bicolor E]